MMTEISNTFRKREKLCGNKSIDTLFAQGQSFIAYPLRVVYIFDEEADLNKQYASVLISVSKKKFKRAVKRNRVKRLIREAYRLNKQELIRMLISQNKSLDIAFIYLKNELPEYPEIEKAIQKVIFSLSDRIGKQDEKNIV